MTIVRIESMAYGGFGVARVDGLVHFVPQTAPGDLVEIEPVHRKKNYSFSRLRRMVEPSPLRTDPFCPYFGECGGCQLQHIRYAEQLKIKQKVFAEQMKRIGGFVDFSEPEILGSEAGRVRMRFQVRGGKLGLFKESTHKVCPIEECKVASHKINDLLRKLQEFPGWGRKEAHGSITVLASSEGSLISATLPEALARELFDHLGGAILGGTILNRGRRIVLGDPYLEMRVQGLRLFVAVDAFWQANPEINEVLVDAVCRFMQGAETVTDLYSGCGNMALPLSKVCGKVIGIEKNQASVEAARHSADMAGYRNLSWVMGDVLQTPIDDAEGLVLDPPRSGLPPMLLRRIESCRPSRIAYVSCNPSTLARDLRRLVDCGYALQGVRLLDMFPHTHHIESLVLLTG